MGTLGTGSALQQGARLGTLGNHPLNLAGGSMRTPVAEVGRSATHKNARHMSVEMMCASISFVVAINTNPPREVALFS